MRARRELSLPGWRWFLCAAALGIAVAVAVPGTGPDPTLALTDPDGGETSVHTTLPSPGGVPRQAPSARRSADLREVGLAPERLYAELDLSLARLSAAAQAYAIPTRPSDIALDPAPRWAKMPQGVPTNPAFTVRLSENQVHGYQWPEGASVTLTIDDPGTQESPDYSDKQTVGLAPWDPTQTFVVFDLQGAFDVQPGHLVTLTDGVTTKEHTVTSLMVTAVDPDADTVSGTAHPGTDVWVQACDESGCVGRHEVADGGGGWTADFSTPGDEPGEEATYDIVPGTWGEANQTDDDGDSTAVSWRVPNPYFWARPAHDQVEGWEWPEGASVTLTIDDPGTQESPDYSDKQTVAYPPWDPGQTYVSFEFQGVFDMEPSHVVTLTDGVTVKTHIVTELAVTEMDPDADSVSGATGPDAEVDVWVCDESGCVWRHEVADPGGAWTADFSTPGDEPGEEATYDIVPGTGGDARQPDDDDDATGAWWQVPAPRFTAWATGAWPDQVHGYDWPEGASVTLTIDDPGTQESPDYSDKQTVVPAPWDPQQTFVPFQLEGLFDLDPGHMVTLTDGITTKEHTVTSLMVTAVDPDADTVSGTADPGADVWVQACDESGCVGRHEVADGGGGWTADFSTPGDEPGEEATYDIGPGTEGDAGQEDSDGDWTAVRWRVPNPAFSVRLTENQVHGYQWPEGASVTLTIDDPGTPESPDYGDKQTVVSDPCCGTIVVFDLQGAFDVQPGHLVTLTDGVTTKEHTVTKLTVTAVDPDADTVSGTADSGTDLLVDIWDEFGAQRHEVADEFGDWTADFSTPGDEPGEENTFDIRPGSQGEARQFDNDDDHTQVGWQVGWINGTVTEDGTGLPLPGIEACLYRNPDGPEPPWTFFVGCDTTSASGAYSVGNLGPGEYKVQFSDPSGTYAFEWYDNKGDFASADLVVVVEGLKTDGIDAALALGGSINGTVTEEGTGDPLPDICVDVTGAADFWPWVGSDVTDGSGGYSVGGLPSGDYRVLFRDCGSPVAYISEWYNDKPDFESADSVPVTAKVKTAGIDAALVLGGSINGTVTEDGTGTPLADVCVSVYDSGHEWFGSGSSDASGTYTVGALPTGEYKVEFRDCAPAVNPHAREWYDGRPDFDSADLVPVTVGVKTGGKDAVLAVSTEKHDVESLGLAGSTSTPGKVPQTYTATVKNNSPVPENVQIGFGVVAPDIDPETITLAPGDLPPGSWIVVGPFVFGGNMVIVVSVPLSPGEEADVPVVVTFPNGYTAAQVNADVCHEGDPPDAAGRGFSGAGVPCTGGSDGYLDADPGNDPGRTIGVTEGPKPPPDLALTKTCAPDPVRTVHHVECSITVSNVGSGEALDVQVVDTLPPEAKAFIDVSPGAPTCTEAAGVVTCNLGTLAADDGAPGGPDEATVIITFQAPKTGGSGPEDNVTITNCAEVSASNEPPENVGPENQACDDTTVLWKCPDVNGDGVASLGDLALIALHWRHSAGPPEDELDQILDLNNDGIVSLGDLAQVAFRWREECL